MSWFSTLPVIFACLALLFIPGSVVLAALGVRKLSYVAVAPVITTGIVAATAILAPYAGVSWSLLPLLAGTAALAVVVFVLQRVLRGNNVPAAPVSSLRPSSAYIVPLMGLAAGAASIVFQLVRAIARPENISQTFDNVFHLNAVRYVLDTGNASSMTLTGMTNGDNPPYFYPAAWHGLASLLVQLTGVEISVAVNVLDISIAAAVWTTGCMFLTRLIVGPKPLLVGAAGALAAGFGSFPLLLLDFGVLYPNFLSVSMIPAALACVAIFFGLGSDLGPNSVTRFFLAPATALAVAIAHPNGVMSLLALSVPVILGAFIGWAYRASPEVRNPLAITVRVVGLAAIFSVLVILWQVVRPPEAAITWLPVQSKGQAVGEILTNSAMLRPPAWAVSILMVVGIFALVRSRKGLWVIGSFLVTAFLFLVVSAERDQAFRVAVTGVWYNDSYRLAALLPIMAVPLAAIGAGRLVDFLQQLWSRRQDSKRTLSSRPGMTAQYTAVVIPALSLVVLMIVQTLPMAEAVRSARANYASTAESPLVSADEMALLEKLDDLVPEEATIAVNPWTGGAMAFAVADRNTTSKHTLTTYTDAELLLNEKLRDAATDPSVCPAARQTGVAYVLDFGTREVHGGNHGFQGLLIPSSTPGFELVAQVGDAKLLELTACR